MLWRYLLSILLLAAPLAPRAQDRCSEAFLDSAAEYVHRSYSYVTPDWQRVCDSFLAICPAWDHFWQMKAMPAIKGGDWANCFSNLSHAVALNPQRWLPYQAFLKCLFTKDYAGALEDFNRCDSMFPGSGVQDHSFDFYRGLCCLASGDLPGAFRFIGRDVRLQEQYRGAGNVHFFSRYYLGHCFYRDGQYRRARSEFLSVLKTYPQFPDANYYCGMCAAALGRRDDARRYLDAARRYRRDGYHSNEDQEFYVNYPFEISLAEIEAALAGI